MDNSKDSNLSDESDILGYSEYYSLTKNDIDDFYKNLRKLITNFNLSNKTINEIEEELGKYLITTYNMDQSDHLINFPKKSILNKLNKLEKYIKDMKQSLNNK